MADMNGHAVVEVTGNEPRCSLCKFYKPIPPLVNNGKCMWVPPPMVAQLYHMLDAEPNTRIDYADTFNHQLPDAMKRGACSEFERKVP